MAAAAAGVYPVGRSETEDVMRSRTALRVLTVTMLGAAAPGAGQSSVSEPAAETLLSIAGGMGAGTSKWARHVSVSASHPVGDVIARITRGSNRGGIGNRADDLALLYGRRTRWEARWARLAAGIGYARGEGEPEKECPLARCGILIDKSSAVGLAIQFDAVVAPSRNSASVWPGGPT